MTGIYWWRWHRVAPQETEDIFLNEPCCPQRYSTFEAGKRYYAWTNG
jgi:hypothetical protein